MPVFKFKDFTGGMVPDVSPHQQQEREFSLAENYRVQHRAMEKIGGQVTEITGMPLSDPNFITYWDPPGPLSYFATALGGNTYITRGNTNGTAINTDLTDSRVIANIFTIGSQYKTQFEANVPSVANTSIYVSNTAGTAISNTTDWTITTTGGGFNMVLNCRETGPLYVVPTGTQAFNLQQLPGWHKTSADGNTLTQLVTADVICSFKGYLVAGNLNIASYQANSNVLGAIENYPSTIRVSSTAAPGSVPQTWVPGTTNTADEFELATTDPIQDLIPSRDAVLAFTKNQCYTIGTSTSSGTPVSALSQVRGLLNKRCAVTVDGLIYFITTDDIMVTSGSALDFKSLVQQTFRDYFFQERLSTVYYDNAFGEYNRYYNEVTFFYPNRLSTGLCNEAIIYNITEQSWTQRTIPPCVDAVYAPTSGNQSGANTLPWTGFNTSYNRLHSQVGNTLYVHDTEYSYLGNATIATEFVKIFDLEQQGLDATKIKKITAIYPFFYGNTNAHIDFVFSNTPFVAPVDFANADYSGSFATLSDYKIDPQRGGRYIAMRVTTDDTNYHNFNNLDLDIEFLGSRG